MSRGQPRKAARQTKVGYSSTNEGQFADLNHAIDDYLKCHRERLRNEVAHYERTSSLRETIKRAARAERPDGKHHDHQRLIPRAALNEAERRLLAVESDLAAAPTFHELFLLVDDAFRPIYGAGALFVYDTALRIGAKLGLRPDQVYLHRGTRDGAKRFHRSPRGTFLDPKSVPAALRRRLSPSEIEDFLCIYKDRVTSWA